LYHNRKQIDAFNKFCNRKGVIITNVNVNQITTALCDEYMREVETSKTRTRTRYNAHIEQIDAFAGLNLTDLEPIIEGRGPHMESGVDLDADPLALTANMKVRMKDTGIRPEIRRRNSSAIPNFSISKEKRSFIRTWVRVHRWQAPRPNLPDVLPGLTGVATDITYRPPAARGSGLTGLAAWAEEVDRGR
jgi:hypothetical protein